MVSSQILQYDWLTYSLSVASLIVRIVLASWGKIKNGNYVNKSLCDISVEKEVDKNINVAKNQKQ